MTGQLKSWTPEEYHRDPCPVPSLSSSIAKVLVTQSPRHAHAAHPRFGGQDKAWTRELSMGAALHTMLLGKGPRPKVVTEFGDWRKKDAKAVRQAIWDAGDVALLEREGDQLTAAYDAARTALRAAGLELVGDSEQAIEWTDEGVVCRSLLDHLLVYGQVDIRRGGGAVIVDLKLTNLPRPDDFGRQVYNLAYDIQAHAYTAAVEAVYPEFAGRVRFAWLVVEMSPPHSAYVAEPGGDVRVLGRKRWQMARETWRRCLVTDEWPGYQAQTISMPGWAETRILEQEMALE